MPQRCLCCHCHSTEVGPPPVEPQPAVVALCRRAMQLSEEALAVLPEGVTAAVVPVGVRAGALFSLAL